MGSDHRFESIYVGHFVSDGLSFGLRPSSSVTIQESFNYNPDVAIKPSSELVQEIRTPEMRASTPSTSTAPSLSPRTINGTLTRPRVARSAETPIPESTKTPQHSGPQPPLRVPIWARGTISRPVGQSPQPQTPSAVRRIQSQATISIAPAPKPQLRRSTLAPSVLRANTVSESNNKSTLIRSSIRAEMPPPRRTFSMPAAATNAGQRESNRVQQMASSERVENASTLHPRATSTKRSGGQERVSLSRVGRRDSSSSATVSTTIHTSTGANTSTAALQINVTHPATSYARTTPTQHGRLPKLPVAGDLRSVASQPQLRQPISTRIKSSPKPTHRTTRLAPHKEEKAKVIEEGECCVCMNAQSDCVLYRCGHVCACMSCAKELKQCPICREQVSDVIKMWKI
jgi:hypothetical protein